MSDAEHWRPTAALGALQARARCLAQTRAFFAGRGVLEVDTPALIHHAVTDVNLHSATVRLAAGPAGDFALHTSPEYAMKRLLAAGSGDIYQLCHVFRGGEQGRHHNPEFLLLEWYRVGFELPALMQEVAELITALLPPGHLAEAPESLTYAQLFAGHLGIDPLADSDAALGACARAQGLEASLVARLDRDGLLDLLLSHCIAPTLGRAGLCFLHHYPASQAALAELDSADARTALRFEVYLQGVELANGFQELASAERQRERFAADQQQRWRRQLPVPQIDPWLLGALEAGLPPCSGVALGMDRLLMIAQGLDEIGAVMAFPTERA